MSNLDVMFSSKSADHLTPGWLLDLVEKVAPIGLDPCGHPLAESSRRAANYLILPTDGLTERWHALIGETSPTGEAETQLVFVNLPYGRALKDWASEKHCAIIALVPARVDTAWWRTLDPVAWCALAGRIRFLDSEGNEQDAAPFPSAVCLLHARHLLDRFVEVFSERGLVYGRIPSASPG